MSADRVSRRALFGLARNAPAARPSFSLDGFYARRGSETPASLPIFSLRQGLPVVETSPRGCTTPPPVSPPWAPARAAAFDGVVEVRPYACLAHQNSPCSVCKERCPEEGAIVMTDGKPRIDPARCTGCGACVGACPAPVNGFDIVPRMA